MAKKKYFVDTNILLYAHDRSAGPKHHRALHLIDQLWASGEGVLSTQVLQELCLNLRRKVSPPLSTADVHNFIEDYLAWEIVTNSPESSLRALELETRYQTSFWHALILHAAEVAGADVLYSEDLCSGQSYGSVTVVNPLEDAVPSV